MAFTVEDGTGVPGANSLTTVAFAVAYFADRGIEQFDDCESEAQEQALVRATDHLEQFDYQGSRTHTDQELSWPRRFVEEPDVCEFLDEFSVPDKVQRACAELALAAFTIDLDPNVTRETAEVLSTTKRAGPLATTQTFKERVGEGPIFRKVNHLLKGLLAAPELDRA